MSSSDKDLAQKWHKQVEGIWHGCPGIYDTEGSPQGYVQADRSIYIDQEEQHWLRVETNVHCGGRLRARLQTPFHLLKVKHVENKRVYEGPDFYGAGYPYGTLVLGNDYCVPWATDNRVTVQLLPGEQLQAYSNVALEGNSLICVITGLYALSRDYETNPQTRAAIDAHREREIAAANTVYMLPHKQPAVLRGEVETYSPDQKLLGMTQIEIKHTPLTQYRHQQHISLTGAYKRELKLERNRHENHYFYEDGLWGNGISFGRALFWRGNFRGETTRIIARDFQVDGDTMAIVWELWRADQLEAVLHGVLKLETK